MEGTKRTKIVCTIGPASESRIILEAMMRQGMNLARLNMSHGNLRHHQFLIRNIRSVSKKLHIPIGIIADLQGPKIRTGAIPGQGIEVRQHERIILVPEKELFSMDPGVFKLVPIQFPGLSRSVERGMTILIDDGMIVLKVTDVRSSHIHCRVEVAGTITALRGINVPGATIDAPVLTDKDHSDLKFIKHQGVDFVALSYVKRADDVERLRRLLNGDANILAPKIIAKIENVDAVRRIDEIIESSDAIMIARGDLGLELPAHTVPIIQKQIIAKCLHAAKPMIVATQMLESMIRNVRPTRAEVSDVANAVIDHTDAVMLSAESAFGRYPVESVSMMRKIIFETEQSPYDNLSHGFLNDQHESNEKAVAHAVHELSKNIDAAAIITATTSGFSARLISRHRPENAVTIALTNHERVYNQASLLWGVEPFLVSSVKDIESLIENCLAFLRKQKIAKKGDRVIIVTGQPIGAPGTMNLIKVQQL